MKKIAVIFLAAVMMISAFSITSFAAGSTTISSDRTTTITPTVKTYVSTSGEVDADNAGAVMSVTIAWDDVDFVYNEITKWNPNTLDYDIVESGWENNGKANVTVTNRSNCQINADVNFDKTNNNTAYADVDATFDKNSALIDSGFGQATAPSENFVLTVNGTPNTDTTISRANLGIITVDITGYNTPSSSTTGGSMDGNDNDG